MYITENADFDCVDRMNFYSFETVRWNGKELKLLDEGENNGAAFAKTILASLDRLYSARMKAMNSVGGNISAEKDPEGSSEITAEVHVTYYWIFPILYFLFSKILRILKPKIIPFRTFWKFLSHKHDGGRFLLSKPISESNDFLSILPLPFQALGISKNNNKKESLQHRNLR